MGKISCFDSVVYFRSKLIMIHCYYQLAIIHTTRKCKKMAGQNTFTILLNKWCYLDRRTLGNKNENAVWVFLCFKWRYLTPIFFKFHATLEIANLALLSPCLEFKIFCCQIPLFEAMNVPFLNFFHNVSLSLPNPEFVSILVKKWIFSKGHPYSIFNLVS